MKNTAKFISQGLLIIIFFALLGYTVNSCKKQSVNSSLNQKNTYQTLAKTISFTDDDIREIARLHNVYLEDMLNAGLSSKTELADYLIINYPEFQNQNRDTVIQMIDYLSQVRQEDLINTIHNHSDKFDHPKLMVNYLNQAYTFLDNFDDSILQNLEMQVRTNLSPKEWQVFYLYISLMRASKQFWVDQGHFNQILSNLPSGVGAKIDIREVIASDVLGVSIFVLGVTIFGIFNPVGAIAALTLSSIGKTAAIGSISSALKQI